MQYTKRWIPVVLVSAIAVITLIAIGNQTPPAATEPAGNQPSGQGEKNAATEAFDLPPQSDEPAPTFVRTYDVADMVAGLNRLLPNPDDKVEPKYSGNEHGGSDFSANCVPDPRRTPAEALGDNIQGTIDPESWHPNGNAADMYVRGTLLIVHQTAANHKKIDLLLSDLRKSRSTQMVGISAQWLLLDESQLKALGIAGAAAPAVVDLSALKEPPQTLSAGSISCFDDQAVYLITARMQTFLTGVEPVVSDSAAAMMPMLTRIYGGTTLQVKPLLSTKGPSVTLDIKADFAQPEEPGKIPVVNARSLGGTHTAAVPIEKLDRASAKLAVFHTTARIPLGKHVLIGVAAAPELDAGKQLCLIVQVTTKK